LNVGDEKDKPVQLAQAAPRWTRRWSAVRESIHRFLGGLFQGGQQGGVRPPGLGATGCDPGDQSEPLLVSRTEGGTATVTDFLSGSAGSGWFDCSIIEKWSPIIKAANVKRE
jgi:hypothetical protein